jgi:hypothetical protein
MRTQKGFPTRLKLEPENRAVILHPLCRSIGLLICSAFAFGQSAGALAERTRPPINLPSQIGESLRHCWTPPSTEPPQVIEVTVRLSFSRDGAVIGKPRVVYVHPAVSELKEAINTSVLQAIRACTPLPFTPSLGAAIAGRIIVVRLRSLPLSGRQRRTDVSLSWTV